MNLLLLLPGRFLYYKDSFVFESHQPAPASSLEQIRQSLEQKEEELAEGLGPEEKKAPPFFVLETESFSDSGFWKNIFRASCKTGRLLVHNFGNSYIFPEYFQTEGRAWVSSFAIHYAQPHFEKQHSPCNATQKKVFIYFNPSGGALPEAKNEACRLADFMEKHASFRFSSRTLAEFELREQVADSDAFFYFGHARFQKGCPIIPFGEAWSPLLVTGLPTPRLLILSSCLPALGQALVVNSESVIYPICRIADRPNSFVEDFSRCWLKGASIGQSFLEACRKDQQKGDIRRYVFRLQGKD